MELGFSGWGVFGRVGEGRVGEGGGASGFGMQLCFGCASDVFAKLHIYLIVTSKTRMN